jgi:hypothetical protein
MSAGAVMPNRHILEEEERHPGATGEFSQLLVQLGFAAKILAREIGRAALMGKLDETVRYDGLRQALFTNRWADGTVDPQGYRLLEGFRLEGTSRVWMEQGANTTYVQYRLRRGRGPVRLEAGMAAGAVRPGPPPGLQRSRDGAILPRAARLQSR